MERRSGWHRPWGHPAASTWKLPQLSTSLPFSRCLGRGHGRHGLEQLLPAPLTAAWSAGEGLASWTRISSLPTLHENDSRARTIFDRAIYSTSSTTRASRRFPSTLSGILQTGERRSGSDKVVWSWSPSRSRGICFGTVDVALLLIGIVSVIAAIAAAIFALPSLLASRRRPDLEFRPRGGANANIWFGQEGWHILSSSWSSAITARDGQEHGASRSAPRTVLTAGLDCDQACQRAPAATSMS
jgi:hypothetical protein